MPDINESKNNLLTKAGKYSASLLKQWFVKPLIGMLLGTLILGRIVNSVTRPQSYSVYFVGPFNDDKASSKDADPTNQIWMALENNDPSLGSLDDVPVVLHRRNDFGDDKTAERISLELAGKRDTLMVIGHLTSTTTRAALPAYLSRASPPIPVILATETNPDLLPPAEANSDEFQPVYRLSPTDDQQARVAACFVQNQGAKAIWVIESGSNHVYSRYLAQEFIERVQGNGPGNKVLLWSTNLDHPVVDAVRALGIDWIFYAGDWQNVLVLLRQLRTASAGKPMPKLILTDSAMDPRLLTLGGEDVKDNVYLTFPVSFNRFHDQGNYAVYGKDARKLISKVLKETQAEFDGLARDGREFRRAFNSLLGLKRVADARNAIRSYMKRSAEGRETFLLAGKTQVEFDKRGSAMNRSFSLWQIKNGQFAGADELLHCPDR